jgi:ribosomal protein S18
LRYLNDAACIDADSCIALRADEAHFVSLSNAYVVDDEKLKGWGYNAKITKQLRILIDTEKTNHLLDYLKSKPNQLDVYIAETKRLQPHTDTDEEEQEEETVGTAPKIVVVEQPSKENVIPTDNVPDTSQAE